MPCIFVQSLERVDCLHAAVKLPKDSSHNARRNIWKVGFSNGHPRRMIDSGMCRQPSKIDGSRRNGITPT